jgi:hypothetical protein
MDVERPILDYAPSVPPRGTPWTRGKVMFIVMMTIDVMLALVLVPKFFTGDEIGKWVIGAWLGAWLLVLPFLVAFLLRHRDGDSWRTFSLTLAMSAISWPLVVFAYFAWIVPARRRRSNAGNGQ